MSKQTWYFEKAVLFIKRIEQEISNFSFSHFTETDFPGSIQGDISQHAWNFFYIIICWKSKGIGVLQNKYAAFRPNRLYLILKKILGTQYTCLPNSCFLQKHSFSFVY